MDADNHLFEVFYDTETEKYYIYAPKGCVLVDGEEVNIDSVDEYGNVELAVSELPSTIYGHVVTEEEEVEGTEGQTSSSTKVYFDGEDTKDGSRYDFKVASFGDDLSGSTNRHRFCTSAVSLGGGKEYVSGDNSNVVFTPQSDGTVAIDVYYV